MKAPVAPGVVPGLLQSIYRRRRTGLLRFERGEERRSVRFINGHIVYGEASVPGLRLGGVLVASGRLQETVLEQALEVMRRDGKRLGAVLTTMGVLDQRGLEEALALHVRTILVSVFALRDGDCAFEELEPETFQADDWPLAVSTAEAVLAAVRALRVRDDVRFALGDPGRVLALSDDPLVLYQRMGLASADGMVLSCVNGERSAAEVLALSGLPPLTAEKSLLGLLCTGLVEPSAAPPRPQAAAMPDQLRREVLDLHAGLATRAPHEVLGVPPEASPAELKVAYFRLAKRYHPDVSYEPGLADLRDKLETVFLRLHDAYRALSAGGGAGHAGGNGHALPAPPAPRAGLLGADLAPSEG